VKEGQRVRLIAITPDLLASGVKLGMIGTVRKTPHGSIGVEFIGHSDMGWNAGLHVICINTKRDGQTIPVISLCEIWEG
jgi:hypothetical protein